jgi:hypothetical protein
VASIWAGLDALAGRIINKGKDSSGGLKMTVDAEQKNTMNLRAGRQFLVNLGWQISQTQIYKHREQGKLRAPSSGEYSVADLLRYARKYLNRTDGAPVIREDDNLVQEKTLAEIRKAKAQAIAWEVKARGLSEKYVTRAWHERELTARALLFRSGIENFIYGNAAEIISLVGGDSLKNQDLVVFMLNKSEEWLATYSTDRVHEIVIPIPEENDEEEGIFPGDGYPDELESVE